MPKRILVVYHYMVKVRMEKHIKNRQKH